MRSNRKKSRQLKSVFLGVLSGLFLLSCVFVPVSIGRNNQSNEQLIQQENLTPARGEAFSAYGAASATISVLLDGKPTDSMSVSPDGHRWYMPQNGRVSLALVPGLYQFKGLYENRIVSVDYAVEAGKENLVILDAVKMPKSPELLMLEIPSLENTVIPLEISDADLVSIDSSIHHMRVIRQNGGFALELEPSLLSGGFYSFTMFATNEWGESRTVVGIRLPRSKEWTEIHTLEDLSAIRHNLSGRFILMNDLDMSEVDDWSPIGSRDYPFTGVFDGGGHEITGFHSPDSVSVDTGFAIFDTARNAEIQNLIIRSPIITPTDADLSSRCAALVTSSYQCHIENCAVLGGLIAPPQGAASGLVNDATNSIFVGLFNSSDIYCSAPNGELKNTGGIGGIMNGYASCLANEGEIFGTHLTGGIIGHHGANLNRCINSGYVWGSTMVGEFPVGAIAQTGAEISITANSYFVLGQAPMGASGYANSLLPITATELRDAESLPLLGAFDGDNPEWAYASIDAKGPIPYGIFKRQVELPAHEIENGKLIFPKQDGLLYYYTLDGKDPRIFCPDGFPSIEITLTKGQVLKVFAARQGYRDSAILTIDTEGGV